MECINIDQITLHSWSYLLWYLRDNATTWLKTRNSSEKSQKLESYAFSVKHKILTGNPDFIASFRKNSNFQFLKIDMLAQNSWAQ